MKTRRILFGLFILLIAALASSFFTENVESGFFAMSLAAPLVIGSLNLQTSDDAKQERKKVWDLMESMLGQVKNEKRNFSAAESQKWDELKHDYELLTQEVSRLEGEERSSLEAAARMAGNLFGGGFSSPEKWINAQGQEIRTFRKGESISQAFRRKEVPGEIGAIIRGLVTGRWTGVSSESRAALATTTSGVEIPAFMLGSILDRTRAKSLIFKAGAQFVEMQGNTLTIGKVTGDATISVKSENDAFPDNSMTFSPLELKAHTIGAVVTISNELLQDGANMAQAIETALIGALAEKLDQLALFGVGSTVPRGLNATTGVISVPGGGLIAWPTLASAWQQISTANGRANTTLLSPRDYSQLLSLEATDGHFVGVPKLFESVNFDFSSAIRTNLGTGENESIAFMGNFADVLVGLRQGVTLEISGVAGEAFQRNQSMIRVLWRGDIGFAKPTEFAKITGLTTGS